MKKIFAILPCYNEASNIGSLIESWNEQRTELEKKGYDLRIVAIDDCSTDDTQNKILEKKEKYDNVDIIIHKQNKGLCGGLNSAVNYFNKVGSCDDLLVLMDGDNTHSPEYVYDMLNLVEKGKNCVIASRYREESNIIGLAKSRELMSEFAKFYYKLILNVPGVLDYTCGYRMYTYDIINKLLNKFGNNPIKEKSFACMMELLYKVYLVGGMFGEVGFELRYDNKLGASKMRVINTAVRSIKTALKLKLEYNYLSLVILVVLILFSTFLSLGTNYSPINYNNLLRHDCSIFSYVAYAMQNGRVLYSEVWENKGPLLYFIYYVGLLFNRRYGIYFLEWLSIFISILYSYKTLKVITNSRIYSLLGVIYSFSIWSVTFEGGTYCESFSLSLICIGLFIFTNYILKDKDIKKIKIIFFGILTGLVAQLRLNLLAIYLGFFLIIGIKLFVNKEYKWILKWLIYGMIGFGISIIPSIIYLVKNDALIECLDSAYFGILSGFATGDLKDRLLVLLKMVASINISGIGLLLIIFCFLFIYFKRSINSDNKFYICSIILAGLLNLYFNSLSGSLQLRYFLTFIPIFVMFIGEFIYLFNKIKCLRNIKILNFLFLILVSSFVSYGMYIDECIWMSKAKSTLQVGIDDYIYNNSKENELVQLIGGKVESVGANFRTGRLSASKYSYLPLWDSFTKERKKIMTNELVEDLKKSVPKLIFICDSSAAEFYDLIDNRDAWDYFLDKNYSIDDDTIDEYVIYVKK